MTAIVGRASHWTSNPKIATFADKLYEELELGAEQSMPQAS
jgi:hypothetical protein